MRIVIARVLRRFADRLDPLEREPNRAGLDTLFLSGSLDLDIKPEKVNLQPPPSRYEDWKLVEDFNCPDEEARMVRRPAHGGMYL